MLPLGSETGEKGCWTLNMATNKTLVLGVTSTEDFLFLWVCWWCEFFWFVLWWFGLVWCTFGLGRQGCSGRGCLLFCVTKFHCSSLGGVAPWFSLSCPCALSHCFYVDMCLITGQLCVPLSQRLQGACLQAEYC